MIGRNCKSTSRTSRWRRKKENLSYDVDNVNPNEYDASDIEAEMTVDETIEADTIKKELDVTGKANLHKCDKGNEQQCHPHKSNPSYLLNFTEHEEEQAVETEEMSLIKNLSDWAVKYNITNNALTALLVILKESPQMSFLPQDARTLLKTSHKALKYRQVDPSIYYHFGLVEGIQCSIGDIPPGSVLELVIGVDGLPIAKSSDSQFWPIMCYIKPNIRKVFLIGLYWGLSKPNDSNDFLSEFITEANDLITNGVNIKNNKFEVLINAICCDAPAKAFLLKIKSHTGFSRVPVAPRRGSTLKTGSAFHL